jgi:AraC-like DNA-binding protein
MSVSVFHRHFKSVTGLSPIQFQKQLRLLEARKAMIAGAEPASAIACAAGYESPSQFNREYARAFGAPPARDAARVRLVPPRQWR